ncbi:autotransporter-associated beta strand repeat-containing protein, partial [Pseudoxanthobacter soli DSM 19599]
TPSTGTTLTLSGVISGSGGLTKTGAGTLVLTATNTYTGGTTVSAGTLQVSGSLAGTASVGSGATLGGAGSITGSVTLASGATLAPGVAGTPGILSTGSLTVGSGAILAFDLAQPDAPSSTLNDRISVTGDLTLAGGLVTVNGGGTFQAGSYRLIDYTGTLSLTGSGLTLSGVPSSLASSVIQTAVAGQINLIAVVDGVSTQWWNGAGTAGSGTITGGDGSWTTTATNWSNVNGTIASSWIAGGLAIFTGTAGTVTLGTAESASGLQFAVTDYVLDGTGTLSLVTQAGGGAPFVQVDSGTATLGVTLDGTAGLTKTGAGTLVLSGTNTYTGGTTVSAGTLQVSADANLGGTGGLTLNGGTLSTTATFSSTRTVALASASTITPSTGTTLTLSGVISGSGGLTKTGAGTLVLSGTNTYSGGTTVSAGTLQIGGGGTSGSIAGDVANNGALVFNRSDATTFAGVISGTGALTQAGAGTLTLSGTNTYTGGTTVSAGTLRVSSDANLGDASGGLTLSGGTLATTADMASARAVALSADGTFSPATGMNLTLSGVISGSGSLTKTGAGTLVLSGTNTYSGGTTVSAGTLQIGNGGTSGSIAGNVANNGALVFNRSDATTFAGVISGTGALTQAGAGTLTLSGTNTYTGGTTVSAGTLQVSADANLGGTGGLTLSGGTLATTDTFTSARTVALASASTITPSTGTTLTLSGVISGSGGLTKTGAGTLVLTGTNTYTGGTTVSAGTLQVSADANLGGTGGLTLSGGTLATTATFTSARTVALSGSSTLSAADATTLTLSGVISGSGGLTKTGAGTLVLSGTNTYTGGTTVSAGTLQIGAGGTSGSLVGAIANTGTVAFNRSDDVTAAGAITGSGALVQQGSGTLTLAGANSAAAGTTVAAGTLEILGGVTLASNILVQSGGTLQGATDGGAGGGVTGSVTVQDGGTLRAAPGLAAGAYGLSMTSLTLSSSSNLDVALGTAAGSGAFSTGTLTLDGVLNVTNAGTMALGVYRIIDYTTLTADNGLTLGSTPTGFSYEIQQAPGAVNLAVLNSNMLYWNGTTTTPDGTLHGGSGIWTANPSDTNWLTAPLNQSVAWNGGFAVFAGTAGAVAVSGPVSTTGLQFMVGGYSVSDGTITLAATSGQTQVRVGDGTLTGAAYTASIDSVLEGATGLEKTDLGTLVLTGGNTYTGGTTVTQGRLQIGNGGSTGSVLGDVTVATGATLAFDRSDAVTFDGSISGAGALIQAGTGTLTLTGTNSFTGGTTISAGTLQVGDGATSGTLSGAVVNAGALIFDRSDAVTFAGALSGTGSLTQAGGGTLTLSGINSFTGTTTVSSGTLSLVGGSSLADGARLTIDAGATLSLGDADETVGSVAGAGTLALGSHALTAGGDNTSSTFSGVISGTGSIIKAGTGTLTLSGTNTIAATTVSAGTLVADGTGALADAVAVTVASGAGLTLQMGATKTVGALSGGGSVRMNATQLVVGAGGASSTFSGVLSGTAGFGKVGTGALTLSGANTFTGTTTVGGGTLDLTGSLAGSVTVQDQATLSGTGTVAQTVLVGAGGTLGGTQPTGLTMGGLTLAAGANTDVTLGATTGGGVFTVNSDVVLDGTLNVTQAAGFGTGLYRIITYGGGLTDNGMEVAALTGGLVGGVQTSVKGQVNLVVESAGSTLQFWNGTQTSPTQSVQGGSGTWSAAAQTNWTNASGTITERWNGGFAIFQGNAGTVTVDTGAGQVATTGMQFVTSGYEVTGGTLTLTGTDPAVIRVGDGTEAGAATVATVSSVLAGTSGLTKSDLGTLVMTADNIYTGGTTISGGTLQLGNGGTTGSLLGDIANTGALVFDRADTTSFDGVISGSGSVSQIGSGTLTLTGTNTYSGGTTVSAGTLRVLTAGALGTGAVTLARGATLRAGDTFTLGNDIALTNLVSAPGNAAIEVDAAKTLTLSGSISGDGALDKTGAGTLVLTGTNTYTGGTTIVDGTLQIGDGGVTGTLTGAIVNNGSLVFNRSDAYSFTGTITGTGTITFTGGGTVRLSSDTTAPITVDDTVVSLDQGSSSASTFTINAGGVLKGTAAIGGLVLNSGGKVAPGYSPGTLTVNGTVTFNSGAIYAVDVTPAGGHDLIVATGNVTISSGASVQVNAVPGVYAAKSQVTILTTSGTVTGSFGSVTSDYAFLEPLLSYDAQNIYLTLISNGRDLIQYAQTPNQANVAVAAQALGDQSPVLEAIHMLPQSAVAPAFNQLSGEVYPSTSTVIQQESVYLRDVVGARLRQSMMGAGADAMSRAADAAGPATAALSRDLTPTLWAQGYGAWGNAFGNGNAATISSSMGGFFLGLDSAIGETVRAGIMAGFSQTQFEADARGSSGSMDNYDVGVYLGGQFGGLGLRGGVSYSWHDIDVQRSIVFPGFAGSESGGYGVGTTQLFGEAAYRMAFGAYDLEPFAGLAYVNVSGGSTTETGTGGAGLGVDVQGMSTLYTSLGARAATTFMLGGRALTPSVTLGWQHAFGDTTPTADMRFLAGSTPFQTQGVPIAEDTLLVGAGLSYALSDLASIQVNYSGQIARQASENVFSAHFSLRF